MGGTKVLCHTQTLFTIDVALNRDLLVLDGAFLYTEKA